MKERAGNVTAAEEFIEFATGASPRLRRTAFLLCGNWHTAEDLAQTTLAKTFVSWRRISRKDAAYAYANRTLVNTYLADRRGKRARELLAGLKRRRRRRASGIVAGAAVVAAVSVIVPALTGARSTTSAPATPTDIPTVYVANRLSGEAGWGVRLFKRQVIWGCLGHAARLRRSMVSSS